jgi:hypothetical protein
VSAGTIGRASTTIRGAGRVARESGDVAHAEQRLRELGQKLEELEAEFEQETAQRSERFDPGQVEIEARPLRPRKSDIAVEQVALVWTPWRVSPEGIAERAF